VCANNRVILKNKDKTNNLFEGVHVEDMFRMQFSNTVISSQHLPINNDLGKRLLSGWVGDTKG
jgi:hypothetical protein